MLALVLAAALSYTLHARDVFQPPPAPPLESWRAPGPRETLEFQTTEGATLRGWLYRADSPSAPCILFFYGSNEDLAHESNRLAWLRDTFHVNAIAFDLPGYGYSGGAITIPSILSASLQEVDYVQAHIAAPSAPVIAYGWSIGTSLAIHAAAERKLAGLILQAPPATAAAIEKLSSKHDVPWYVHGVVSIKADSEVRQLYEGAAAIHSVPTPLLVLQGSLDDVVPPDQGPAIVAASPATQKQFVQIPGAHHNDLHYKDPPASDAIRAFLAPFSR